MLLMPFSTDQFAGAAAVQAARLGDVLDPNASSAGQLRSATYGLLKGRPAAER
jgi:zeaxanthin glucosyltransferase